MIYHTAVGTASQPERGTAAHFGIEYLGSPGMKLRPI